MRVRILMLLMLLSVATSTPAQVSISFNLSLFPELVQVPGHPVYYAPRQAHNYFFYDGLYWVFDNDEWYSSSWYNGPWWRAAPEYVPAYILRVPVRYYRRPPGYFQGWQRAAPPRWGDRWGRDWEQRRSGWDKWDRRAAPKPAPLPVYQRKYAGDRYPRGEQQSTLTNRNYRYQPRDALVREHFQPQNQRAATPGIRQGNQESQRRDPGKDARDNAQRQAPARGPVRQEEPPVQRQQQQPATQREQPKPAAQQPRPQPQAAPQREQQMQKSQGNDSESRSRGGARQQDSEPGKGRDSQGRDKGSDKGRDKGEERGRDSNK